MSKSLKTFGLRRDKMRPDGFASVSRYPEGRAECFGPVPERREEGAECSGRVSGYGETAGSFPGRFSGIGEGAGKAPVGFPGTGKCAGISPGGLRDMGKRRGDRADAFPGVVFRGGDGKKPLLLIGYRGYAAGMANPGDSSRSGDILVAVSFTRSANLLRMPQAKDLALRDVGAATGMSPLLGRCAPFHTLCIRPPEHEPQLIQ